MTDYPKETGIRRNSKQIISNVFNSNANSNVSLPAPHGIRRADGQHSKDPASRRLGQSSNEDRYYGRGMIDAHGDSSIPSSRLTTPNQSQTPLPPPQPNPNLQNSLSFPSPSPSQHLHTSTLIPNFRDQYQQHQLLQQIGDLKRTLQLKNKQIFYLSNQLVSVKDQYAQKIVLLENAVAEGKREVMEFRYAGMKGKRVETDRMERMVDECKKSYQLQIHNLQQSHQSHIQSLRTQHTCQLDCVTQKLTSILNLQKSQKQNTQQLSIKKQKNYQHILQQLQTQIDHLRKEREKDEELLRIQGECVEKLRDQFRKFSQKAVEVEKGLRGEVEGLKGRIKGVQDQCVQLKSEKTRIQTQYQQKLQQAEQQLELLKHSTSKLKQSLAQKDKQLSSHLEHHFQSQSPPISPHPPGSARPCNHQSLIGQLQRNILLKNKENQELRQQLREWGHHIGFVSTLEERTHDLVNVSQGALEVQKGFANSLRKRVGKL